MKIKTQTVYAFNKILSYILKLKILDTSASIELLINSEYSLRRFGDGELSIIMGGDIHFQNYHPGLASQLKTVLKNVNNPPLLKIGIPLAINSVSDYKKQSQDFWRDNMNTGRMHWFRFCGFRNTYLNASLTRCFFDYENKNNSKFWFEELMKLWAEKKILIIEGETSHLGLNNGLFSNTKAIDRVICPAENAWDKYDEIFYVTQKIAAGYEQILVSLGPTATILARDICALGYRIIDIGHLNLEYEMYLRANEHIERELSEPLTKEDYQNQIIMNI